jgi:hypothetical protein
MKASALSCNQEHRIDSIRKGKASQFLIITKDGIEIKFWSYENVLSITGYKYKKIL